MKNILCFIFTHEEVNNKIIVLDKTSFVYNSLGDQIFVFWGIEIKYKPIRLGITKLRNLTIENFVNENFLEGPTLPTTYSFLNKNINYSHETHNHEGWQFTLGYDSTAYIENFLGKLVSNHYVYFWHKPQKILL